ncbi:MAG: ParB/RepB/Spo0J family partition protein [Novosphingobium sp.]
MARKQSDYLAGLLADEEPQVGAAVPAVTPSPTSAPEVSHDRSSARAGLSLLSRESALARVASGEVRQVTQLLLDPARVRVWAGNARLQAQLSESNCLDLIDSIVAEGGQKVPAVVRHLQGDPAYDYELIAGTRRHFAISWLRDHSYPEMRLLAQVADLDDESAFRLADVENRARKDISDIERARNYADAVDRHYGGKAVRMAERLKLSKGWLSKMLKAAALPDAVLDAFSNWHELTLNPAYKLATAMDDKDRAIAIIKEAKVIVAAAASPPLPGSAVLARLMAAKATLLPPATDFRMEVGGDHGRPILSVKGVNRQGVTLHLPMASGASDDQIADAVREVLDALRQNGVSVK